MRGIDKFKERFAGHDGEYVLIGGGACDLLRSYDTEVSVREPKVVNDFDGVGMRRWTVSVNTNIARPDLPKQ